MIHDPGVSYPTEQGFKFYTDISPQSTASERRTVGGKQASAGGRVAEDYRSLTYGHKSPGINTKIIKYPKLRVNDPTDTIEYYPEASLIRLKHPLGKEPKGLRTWKRGICKMMSSRSRRRVMNLFSMLIRTIVPLFVTLTYPKDYPDSRDSKRHLQAFIKRLKRRWPEFGYIWKLELQKRGAPHYHIFMWGVPRAKAYLIMSQCWYEVVGSNDPWHAVRGVKIEEIKSYKGVKSYASKYIAKRDEQEVPEGLGRTWGYGGKIPLSEKEEYVITPQQAAMVLRYLRRRIRTKNKGIKSFYVDNPARWRDLHGELTGDKLPF